MNRNTSICKRIPRPATLPVLMLFASGPGLFTAMPAQAGVFPDTPDRLWPGGVIPYQYDTDVTDADQICTVEAAMDVWEGVANIQFVPRNGEANYLLITQGTSGPRYPPPEGFRNDGEHQLLLNNWGTGAGSCNNCQAVFGLVHEFGHVLGYLHTHQSVFRDNYFNYNPNVVVAGTEGNFAIDASTLEWPPNFADIDSIMSYPLCVFSTCGNCAADLANCAPLNLKEPYATAWAGMLTCPTQCPPPVQCVGQRNHLSDFESLLTSFLYPQPGWRFADVGSTQRNEDGRFHYPYKSFPDGEAGTPGGGTLWAAPGLYAGSAGVYSKTMLIKATLSGSVLIRE